MVRFDEVCGENPIATGAVAIDRKIPGKKNNDGNFMVDAFLPFFG